MSFDLLPSEPTGIDRLLCIPRKKDVPGIVNHGEHEADLDVGEILNLIAGENIIGGNFEVFLGINLQDFSRQVKLIPQTVAFESVLDTIR